MAEFKQIIDDALDILKFDGAVQDTLAELREKWGAQVPALLDERFDAVGVQYMKLSHEKGAAALGQELSAFGWVLYNLDDEDEYLFALIPEEERSEWERYCKKQGQYCHLMKQQGRKWGDHAKEQDPGKLMPCEEYILQDEYDYFFNSLAGDFAAGEWKNQDAEEWKNGCVADLRQRPPQVTRAHSLPHLGCLTYSAENGLYAASRAAGSGTIGRALLSKNPATLNWFEPSPIGYDGPPQTLCWADHSLWVGDPTNATRIELTDRGTCQDVKNWPLPEDGWSTKYHCGITTDGLGRVYFSNEWYKGQIYRWENGKVTKHTFSLDGYDHLSEAVPVPGTGRITMIHAVSGKGRMEECLLELDMDTGRCRIAPLPGMGEGLKLRWFTGDWLLVQGNGAILSDDFAQLINRNTRDCAAGLSGARLFCGGGRRGQRLDRHGGGTWLCGSAPAGFHGFAVALPRHARPDQRVFGHTSAGARHRTCDRRQHGDRNRSAGGNHGGVRPGDTAGERPACSGGVRLSCHHGGGCRGRQRHAARHRRRHKIPDLGCT